MDLDTIMLSESSQEQKMTCVILFTQSSGYNPFLTGSKLVVARRWEKWGIVWFVVVVVLLLLLLLF